MARREPLIQPGSFLGAAPPQEEPKPDLVAQIIEEDRARSGRGTAPPVEVPATEEEPKSTGKQVNTKTSKHVNMFAISLEEALKAPPEDLHSLTARVDKSIPLRIQREVLNRKERGEKVTTQTLVNAILVAGLKVLESEKD